MSEFTRDKAHWLYRLSPDEWIAAALGEVARAEKALGSGDVRAGVVGLKRAAGMGLNAALIAEPDETWGRTYVEHVEALARDARVPEGVRAACRAVLDVRPPGGDVIDLRTPRAHQQAVDAARDVVAHAWAVMTRHARTGESTGGGPAASSLNEHDEDK